MPLSLFDVPLRIATVTLLLSLAFLLFQHRRVTGLPGVLFLPLAFCLSGFIAGNSPDTATHLPGLAGTVAHVIGGFAVIFLWWFCLACFDRDFHVRGPVLWVGLGWAAVAGLDRGLMGSWLANQGLSWLLVGMGFGIVGHLGWRLLEGRGGDLVQRRYDARPRVTLLLGGLLLVDLTADLLFGLNWRPVIFSMSQNAAILGFCLWLGSRVLSVRAGFLTFQDAAPCLSAASPPIPAFPTTTEMLPVHSEAEAALMRRLSFLIEKERIFLDPALDFAGFVEQMQAPERTVRRLINQELGFDHFRTFLNHHRVEAACRRLAEPDLAGDKLIGVALDSGFASLASFNRVFRTMRGCTPSQYRQAALTSQTTSAPGFEE